ncbi:hypothetical protein SAMN05216532_8294 [Streptomyces sp. 2231.1]|nr:hypothetical protein SAMN05216532_8294 [Streptomyces sp. 2231.1]
MGNARRLSFPRLPLHCLDVAPKPMRTVAVDRPECPAGVYMPFVKDEVQGTGMLRVVARRG